MANLKKLLIGLALTLFGSSPVLAQAADAFDEGLATRLGADERGMRS